MEEMFFMAFGSNHSLNDFYAIRSHISFFLVDDFVVIVVVRLCWCCLFVSLVHFDIL